MGQRRSFRIKQGLDLPITGECQQVIEDACPVTQVAVVGTDYHDLRPTMAVEEGDDVCIGQLLFEDKRRSGIRFTSPAGGKVVAIHRGSKRRLLSVVIDVASSEESEAFEVGGKRPEDLDADTVRKALVESGLWTGLRTRPYSKVPLPDQVAHSIFVTAIDTNPLAADPAVVLAGQEDAFNTGLAALAKLTDGEVHLCTEPGATIPDGAGRADTSVADFAGPHPAGLPGTHIHFIDPVGQQKSVFFINYQDVLAIGGLFLTGKIDSTRVVALGGPPVKNPRLLRTRIGANLSQLMVDETDGDDLRVISGSVLSGRTAADELNYLGRWHLQVSVLSEGREREFLGWQSPGLDKFSIKNIFLSKLTPGKRFAFTTSTNGSPRAIVPVGSYEAVMPLDIIPVSLMKSLVTGDAEVALELGCLELDEEDLSLCTFVCPGKTDYGPLLRSNLEIIEKEF